MNERIRQCADGAGLDSNWKPGFDSIYGQQLGKFAELIVRESMDVVSTCRGTTKFDHWTAIKEHFGVE